MLAEHTARGVHSGERDKGGDKYIEHVWRVARRLSDFEHSIHCAAWLHDVLENTAVDLETLRAMGFSTEVLSMVDAVTRRDGESIDSYLNRVLALRGAATVKRADLSDNMRPERLAKVPEPTRERLQEKYRRYLSALGSHSTSTIADILQAQDLAKPEISWRSKVDCDPLQLYHGHHLQVAQMSLDQTVAAAEVEPSITATLVGLTPRGARLHGLSDRLKSPSSLARKIMKESLAVLDIKISDQVRYTLVHSSEELVAGTNEFFEDLRSRGWSCVDLRHTYFHRSPFKGIRALLRSYGANAREVEIQLDTEESLRAKAASRELYEMSQERPGNPNSLHPDEILERRIAVWQQVAPPQGLDDLAFGNRQVIPHVI